MLASKFLICISAFTVGFLCNLATLADTADDVKKKIMSMYTDPEHLQVSDPGHIEGNTVIRRILPPDP